MKESIIQFILGFVSFKYEYHNDDYNGYRRLPYKKFLFITRYGKWQHRMLHGWV